MVSQILGITGFIFGVLAFIVGFLYPSKTFLTAGLACIGTLLLTIFFVTYFEAFRTFSRRRSTHLGFNTLLMVVFFSFIVILLNLIVRQFYFRYDLSSSGKFSLSQQSMAVAGSLNDDLRILYFGDEESGAFRKAYHLLESYRYLNRKIVYEMHDLDRTPLMAREYGVNDYDTFVVKSKKRIVKETGGSEEVVTSLLIRASRGKTFRIAFLQGHNEPLLTEKGRAGYSGIAEKTESLGFRLAPLNIISAGGIPDETDLLIIADPDSPLSESERDMILRYRDRGGTFLLLVNAPGQLDDLLHAFGFSVSAYPVYDTVNVAGTDPSSPLVSSYPDSPITAGLGLSTVFPGVYEVRYMDVSGTYSYLPVVLTSQRSWLEMNGDGVMQKEERKGPYATAGMALHKDGRIRVAVFGDSEFISNAYYSVSGNADLFLNAVNWLVGEKGLAGMTPSRPDFLPMFITDEQAGIVRISAFLIPIAILIIGTVVWMRRRGL